jgi:hypothetical protein
MDEADCVPALGRFPALTVEERDRRERLERMTRPRRYFISV